jgi:glucoamylase
VLKIVTPYGPCWRRYNHDGYGQRKDGGPFLSYGQGRAWPIMTGERAHYELAAGENVASYITALERFSSIGGMLPEQVWDYADMPSEGLYFGRSAGSAQPLVWAHAEYVKLLRSVADGHVFDRISVVEERYAVPKDQRQFMSRMEIYHLARPISEVMQGGTLRIVDTQPFEVTWSVDGWATTEATKSAVIGPPGSFADLAVEAEVTGKLVFTLFWPGQNRWLGKNVEVSIRAQAAPTMPAGEKPKT